MIISSSNDKIKNIRKLRLKKYRNESGQFFIEGARIVIEGLERKEEIQDLLITPKYALSKAGRQVLQLAQDLKINIIELSEEVFETISQKEGPQGVGAVVMQKRHDPWLLKDQFSGVWVGLCEIADPGNLGTILRTCDATNVNGIILIGNCADPYDPTCLRASMGAIFSKNLVKINESDFIQWALENQIHLVGTADSADRNYREQTYPKDMVLVMGSERQGIPDQIQNSCNVIVSIPMKGACDSLNLSVATGVVLYEILNQHESGKPEKEK